MAFVMSRRRLFAIGVLLLVALLYYRPLTGYFASQSQYAQRVAQLAKYKREEAAYERKLREASSPAALAAQERLLGFVQPGQHLYIVKNIKQWRHRHDGRHGR